MKIKIRNGLGLGAGLGLGNTASRLLTVSDRFDSCFLRHLVAPVIDNPSYPIRLNFAPHACHERMFSRFLRGVEDFNGASSRRNHRAVGEADPHILILRKKLIAHAPVGGFILAPIGMDLPCNARWKLICNTVHSACIVATTAPVSPPPQLLLSIQRPATPQKSHPRKVLRRLALTPARP